MFPFRLLCLEYLETFKYQEGGTISGFLASLENIMRSAFLSVQKSLEEAATLLFATVPSPPQTCFSRSMHLPKERKQK